MKKNTNTKDEYNVALTTILGNLTPTIKFRNRVNNKIRTVKEWRQLSKREKRKQFALFHDEDKLIICHIDFGEILIEQKNEYNSIW